MRTRLLFLLTGFLAANSAFSQDTYRGSRFQDVWAAASENPYAALPEEKVNLASFYSFFTDKLQQASERTLNNRNDVLPYFRKLLHPNAICLAGTWNITEHTAFSGYFRSGSKGAIILRASAALSEIKRGEKRAFGIAGKIFPTTQFAHKDRLETANFFLIDNLGGTYQPNFLDTALTNDITNIDFGVENIDQSGILVAALKAFGFAEKIFGSILTVRQLYEISELGEAGEVVTPKYMKIQGQPGFRSQYEDFRDDLRIASNGGPYRLDISVAEDGVPGLPKDWQKIGYIEVQEAVAAEGCDHKLHFHHPKWKNGLK